VAGKTDVFDLGRLQLSSGQGRAVDLRVELEELEFGGQRYGSETSLTDALLDVTRTRGGYSLRLRLEARLAGPCMRCLEDARTGVEIDAREIDQPGGDDDDLSSPYVDGDDLDVRAWARDALALALPAQIVCREECRGLCAICGQNLNEAPEHEHERAPDPRFAKLSELRFEQ
jgi:uncharacterized protein